MANILLRQSGHHADIKRLTQTLRALLTKDGVKALRWELVH